VDYGLIRDAQVAWKEFFQSSIEFKEEFLNRMDPNYGYAARYKERGVGAPQADLKEFYHYKPGSRLPNEAADVTYKLFNLLEYHIAPQLLQALNGIGSGMDYAAACQDSDNTILRTIYYPALSDMEVLPGAVRSASHEDINFITLLVAASSPGLQVKDVHGNWHNVPHEENSITVNIGDMLQMASQKILLSTSHRVINPDSDNEDRISMPLFVHPKSTTLLAPGFTAQQYLEERLDQIYQRVK
jgi:isopenicillin N synthase-like dioxygenase